MERLSLKEQEIFYKLCQLDPDYIVDVLEISSQELLETFMDKTLKHIQEEYGNDDD